MMKRYLALFALLLLPMLAWGQGNTVTLSGSGAPSGGCAFIMRYIDIVGQVEYACDTSGNWFQVGPGAAGATSLSSVTNPTGNKAFDLQTYSLTWNWATGNTSTTNLFSVADNATNTGTGYLFTVSSGSGSATKPFRACYRGTTDCVTLDTTTLSTSGAAVIDATKLSGALPALNGSALTNVDAATLGGATFASPGTIGGTTPGAITGTTITANTAFVGSLTGNADTATSAAKWTTARTLAGNSVDGSANVAFSNKFIVQGTTDAGLSGAQFLGALGTGLLKNTTTTGVLSIAASSDVIGLWGGTCNSGTYLSGAGTCTTPGGSISGLTTSALVTAASATTIQTPSATATLDTSGNISTPGSISSGVGGSTAGGLELTQGTAPTLGTNTFTIFAPTGIATSYGWSVPTGENGSAGILHVGAPTSHVSALTVGAVDLTAEVSGILPAANGGTGNGFTAFSGPATSTKTFALPNASATILTSNMFTNHAVQVAGTTSLTQIAMSNDQVLMGNTGGDPSSVSVNNCGDSTHALSYNTTTHAWGCQAITATAAPAGSDTQVQYNNAGSLGAAAGFTFDKTSKVSLGVAGASVGAVAFANATSGTVTIQPTTGALGTVTLTLPARTATFGTTTGTLTNGNITKFDVSGNVVDASIAATNVGLITNRIDQNNAATTSAQFAGVISDETGSGKVVFDTSPALVTPNLGVPSAVDLTNGTHFPHVITFSIDGGGSAITTGDLGTFPTAAFACTINRWDVSADQSGSISIDIWKRAGAIPTSAQKISASAPVALSTAQLAQNGSLTGWTTAVSSGDVFGATVASAATVTKVTVQIWCQ